MIDITGVDLKEFAKVVYELSKPQGFGFLHAKDGGLSDADAQELLDSGNRVILLRMDYVHGRACKMTVRRQDDGRHVINTRWHDHSDEALKMLLDRFGIDTSLVGS